MYKAIYKTIVLGFLFSPVFLNGQTDISFEFQAYPTGLIPGISIDKSISSRSDIYLRAGYNWIRHRDLGKHEDERGSGVGGSIGYKKYFKDGRAGWRIGIKNDFWWNSIDWTEGNQNGNTKITVVQPTAELAYVIRKNEIVISPSIAFGYELNIKTEGEETGEGAILLVGVQLGKSF
ncbi:MAG: hypothetical protein HKN67_03730 [Saprospiraceae bacterium]|nr:hypothetical protein [Bacteroidia bacterium]MBT8229437.1 hypothetical protein [Bacteroidia bacterium]NNF21027.1 hypothetical protein [Saprospiraceae bacterium]